MNNRDYWPFRYIAGICVNLTCLLKNVFIVTLNLTGRLVCEFLIIVKRSFAALSASGNTTQVPITLTMFADTASMEMATCGIVMIDFYTDWRWKNILVDPLRATNMSITRMRIRQTIELRILN